MSQPMSNNTSARRAFIKLAIACTTAVGAGSFLRLSPALAQQEAGEKVTQQAVDTILAGWPEKQREVARHIVGRYGLPNGGTTTSRLTWLDNGPWKYSILYREEVPHNFPIKHTDVLEQAIAYRVPPEKYDELVAYNGSLTVRRTKGEMSVMCDKEERHFLALNLAHDIITGKLGVEEARRAYTTTVLAFMKGEKHPYTQALQFQLPQDNVGDPDRVTATM